MLALEEMMIRAHKPVLHFRLVISSPRSNVYANRNDAPSSWSLGWSRQSSGLKSFWRSGAPVSFFKQHDGKPESLVIPPRWSAQNYF
jgi:hypothetical protein